ncbi:MAG: ferric reductase-like transmembrane domain-containing protein [Solirubrobacteraceae bacterium]
MTPLGLVDAVPHLFWITSRASGIVALVLASLSVSLGLAMSLRLLRSFGPDRLALHEALSIATLVALAVHGLSLVGDPWLHPSLVDVSVPFAGSYETAWTSLGIIAGWALALLGLSYRVRRWIGAARWRSLHRLTAVAWLAGLAHSLGEGSDSGQLWFLAMVGAVAIPALALLAARLASTRDPGPPPRRPAVPLPE